MAPLPIRIATIGAGRAFQRLYLPALKAVPGLHLVAAADPSSTARAGLPSPIRPYSSLAALLAIEDCQALLVLSPGSLHAEHAALALERSLPVLLEKPSATCLEDLATWPPAWHRLVTPARPRRYWRRYLQVRNELATSSRFGFLLQTVPGDWGATEVPMPTQDLLPHVLDLAAWVSRSPISGCEGTATARAASGRFELADGRPVDWEVAHGDEYQERISAGPVAFDLSRQSFWTKAAIRIGARPAQDVEGIARMLTLWERRLRGDTVPALPAFSVALEELSFRQQLKLRREQDANTQLQRDDV